MGTFKDLINNATQSYAAGTTDSLGTTMAVAGAAQLYAAQEANQDAETKTPSSDQDSKSEIPSWLQPNDPSFPSDAPSKEPMKITHRQPPTFDEAAPEIVHNMLEERFISESFQGADAAFSRGPDASDYMPPSESGFREYIMYQQLSGADADGLPLVDKMKLEQLDSRFSTMPASIMDVYESAYDDYQNRMEMLDCYAHNHGLSAPGTIRTMEYRTPRPDNPYAPYMDTMGEMYDTAAQRVTEIAKSTDNFSLYNSAWDTSMELTNEMRQYPQWESAYAAVRDYCVQNNMMNLDCSSQSFSEQEVAEISDYIATYTPEGHERYPTGLVTPEFIEIDDKDLPDMVSGDEVSAKNDAATAKSFDSADKTAKQYTMAQQELNVPEDAGTAIDVGFEMQ